MGDDASQEFASDPATPAYDLGVLFVHGIGEQRRGQTLSRCAGPLFKTLSQWASSGSEPVDIVIANAHRGDSSVGDARYRGDPDWVSLRSTDRHLDGTCESPDRQSIWLLAESWWAEKFVAPKMSQLFMWSLQLTARAARQVVRPRAAELRRYSRGVLASSPARLWKMSSRSVEDILYDTSAEPDVIKRPGVDEIAVDENISVSADDVRDELAITLGEGRLTKHQVTSLYLGTYGWQIQFGVFVASYLLAFLAGVLALIAVPTFGFVAVILVALFSVSLKAASIFPKLGRSARRIQLRIAGSIGDAYVWQEDPVYRAQLIAQLETDLQWIAARCKTVALVAHSQGSAITHALLRTRNTPDNLKAYLTYGTAIRLLNSQGRATEQNEGLQEDDLEIPGQGTERGWIDFVATNDPVAVEPLPDAPGRKGIRVRNEYSTLRDHSSYWQNIEQFVLPMSLALARLDPKLSILDSDHHGAGHLLARARNRRIERGALLRLATFASLAPLVLLLAIPSVHWVSAARDSANGMGHLLEFLPSVEPVQLSRLVDNSATALVAATAAMAIGCGLWMLIFRAAFRRIERSEGLALLRRERLQTRSVAGYVAGFIICIPVCATLSAAAVVQARTFDLRFDPAMVIGILSFTLIMVATLAWRLILPSGDPDEENRQTMEERKMRGKARLLQMTTAEVDSALNRNAAELKRRVRMRRTISSSASVHTGEGSEGSLSSILFQTTPWSH